MRLPATDHVPASTVRFWALMDSGIVSMALPFTSPFFLGFLYWLNGLLGGVSTVPAFDALAMFFVNLAGVLVVMWIVARLTVKPAGRLILVEIAFRVVVALLLVWYLLAEDVIPVLWLFVGTELIGAIAQWRAVIRRPA